MNTENLLKLAAHLRSLPPDYDKFHMMRYHTGAIYLWEARSKAAEHPCGTVACAIGHGPSAGIPVENDPHWPGYSERVFDLEVDSRAWCWCFDYRWTYHNNTPLGAAERIEHLVETGLPGDFPWSWSSE